MSSSNGTPPVTMEGPVCPVPLRHNEQVVMGHGSGGKMSHDLIGRLFMPPFDNPVLAMGDDAGVISLPGGCAWPSAPIPMWCGRCFSRVVTLADWPCVAR